MTTKLAPHQIAQDVYDEANSAIRTTLQNLEISMELSADDGDSVEARVPLFSGKATVPFGTATNTPVAEGDTRYFSEYLVAVNVTSPITSSALKIEIDVSPSDTDNVWHHETTLDVNVPSTGFFHIKNSNIGAWRRARARVVHNNYTAGSFDLYVNGR
jgi:hypothetical protein